jgi:eukaryotic-like serine/threonine-protein kinase
MSLEAGARLGPYEILSALGAGGMGEVYRAKDTYLKRDVALKILPDAFAADPDRVARFQREAELLATLNHPNIASIYGVEQADGVRALVLELVEGPTLADRIAQGPIPVEEALVIATHIADALEAAHERGVIHRDLKPANIKLTADDKVKVLDFGLAKMLESPAAPAALSMSPTLSVHATYAGVILGTAAYMSPEQARGKAVDKRADIWAFGCVLFEMLTGTRPFDGEDVAEMIGAVIHKEPRWADLPAMTPPTVRTTLLRCLEKDQRQRMRDIGDVRLALGGAFETASSTPSQSAPVSQRPLWRRAAFVGVPALLVGTALASGAWWYLRPLVPPPVVTRFPLTIGEGLTFTTNDRGMVAISPDGTQIAYVANRKIYLRLMSENDPRPIQGTENSATVANPVFSPDGKYLAFWSESDHTIKRISVAGGAAVTICQAPDNPWGGMSWTAEGLAFNQNARGQDIMRVSANGGRPERIASSPETGTNTPQLLPGGEYVLFTLFAANKVAIQSIKTGRRKTIIESGAAGHYVSTGHIVYALEGNLLAVPFDLRKLELTGGPVPVVEGVRRMQTSDGSGAHFTVSDTGSLVYVPGPASTAGAGNVLGIFDRNGSAEPLKTMRGLYAHPRVSRDGKWLTVATEDGKEAIVWVYELSGASAMRRLTLAGNNRYPIWSSDGQYVAYQSDREGDLGIFRQRADGNGTPERSTKPEQGTAHIPQSWSPKGDTFLFSVVKGSSYSLWSFSLKDKKATPFGGVQSSNPINAVFSPDGRWVAYSASDPQGRNPLYVQPFPPNGTTVQIARVGGGQPLWSPDGKELFYNSGGGQYVVVSVTTQPTFTLGNPVQVPHGFATGAPTVTRNNDMMPDGKILGIAARRIQPGAAATTAQIQVVLNWFEELKQRVPTK